MTVTVDAGLTVGDLQRLLAREGQWLPIAPPLPDDTTVGGLVAADLGGLHRATQGRVRDFVIGIAAVLTDGTIVRGGGKVVKNVAGYDLMKLLIGSFGTLAVVVEATFKVRPIPPVRRTIVLACRDARAALAFAETIHACGLGTLAAAIELPFDDTAAPRVVLQLAGVDADVAVERAAVLSAAAAAELELAVDADASDAEAAAIADGLRDLPRCTPHVLVARLTAAPQRALGLAAAIVDGARGEHGAALFDPHAGSISVALLDDRGGGGRPDSAGAQAAQVLGDLAALVGAHGAHLTVERWPVELADYVTVWSPFPPPCR